VKRAIALGSALVLIGCFAACGRRTGVNLGFDYAIDHRSETPSQPPMGGEPAPPPTVQEAGTTAPPPPPPPPVCQSGFADCDGRADNGCETDLRTSALHCGACGLSCPHAECACEAGMRVVRCPLGRADCDSLLGNGCEVDVTTDPMHCGACGSECHARGASVSGASCTKGSCALTCEPSAFAPMGDCDKDIDNGCEALLWADPNNCGSCGVVCAFCSDSVCL
jgi:hypothetical protein